MRWLLWMGGSKQDFQHFLCPCIKRLGAFCFTMVCLSAKNFMWKLNILLLLNSFSYKAHIWYEGTSYWYTCDGISVKVIFQGYGQILRYHFRKKDHFREHYCFTNPACLHSEIKRICDPIILIAYWSNNLISHFLILLIQTWSNRF